MSLLISYALIFEHMDEYQFLEVKFLGGKVCAFSILVDFAKKASKEVAPLGTSPMVHGSASCPQPLQSGK